MPGFQTPRPLSAPAAPGRTRRMNRKLRVSRQGCISNTPETWGPGRCQTRKGPRAQVPRLQWPLGDGTEDGLKEPSPDFPDCSLASRTAWPTAAPEHCPALARAAAPSAPQGVGALPTPPRWNHRQHRPPAARQTGSHSHATTTSSQGHGGQVSLLKAPPVPRTDSARTPRGQPTWTLPATPRSPGGLGTSQSPTGTSIGVDYWCYEQICLLSATLFDYSNNRGIDRLGRMPWPWPLLIDHLFVKMTFNNHK